MHLEKFPPETLLSYPTDYFVWQQEQPLAFLLQSLAAGDGLPYIFVLAGTLILGIVLLQLVGKKKIVPQVSAIDDHDRAFIEHLKKLSHASRKDASKNFRRGVLLCLLSLVLLLLCLNDSHISEVDSSTHRVQIVTIIAAVLQALAGLLVFQGKQYAVMRHFAETYIVAIYESNASKGATTPDTGPDTRLVLLQEMSKIFADMRHR